MTSTLITDRPLIGIGSKRLRAKNVILMIGDGMGPVQRQAGRLAKRGPLVMDALPVRGLMETSCADPIATITDSAAAATALATGVKTYNGAIGVGLDGQPLPTILEHAKQAGLAAGLVTTCQITDATPAAFAAHVAARTDHSEIARQFIEESGVDVILGGGEDYWFPEGVPGAYPDFPEDAPNEWSRGTRGNLVERAQDFGYRYASNREQLLRAESRKLLGLLANQELFRQKPEGEGDRYDPDVTLAEMTNKAISTLARHNDGFFLMIEEAAIDRMAHQNNTRLAIKGVLELDRAVLVAQAFAEADGETLVIVTADHECGGLAIAGHETELDTHDVMSWATTGHTDVSVPLTAYGPGADLLAGEIRNTDLFDALIEAMGLR
ncbi:MAG: alkaline phosphatase [Thermomicrobiales bacterium]